MWCSSVKKAHKRSLFNCTVTPCGRKKDAKLDQVTATIKPFSKWTVVVWPMYYVNIVTVISVARYHSGINPWYSKVTTLVVLFKLALCWRWCHWLPPPNSTQHTYPGKHTKCSGMQYNPSGGREAELMGPLFLKSILHIHKLSSRLL